MSWRQLSCPQRNRWRADFHDLFDMVSVPAYRIGGDRAGHDNIVRTDATITWRVHGEHGVALKYLFNRRDASYPDVGRRTQTRSTLGLYYVLLGQERFGAVDWRP